MKGKNNMFFVVVFLSFTYLPNQKIQARSTANEQLFKGGPKSFFRWKFYEHTLYTRLTYIDSRR